MAAYYHTHSPTSHVVVLSSRRPSIQPFRFQTFYESQTSRHRATEGSVSIASPTSPAQQEELEGEIDELAHKLDNTISDAASIIGQASSLTSESIADEVSQVSSSSDTTMAPATPVHNGGPFTPAKQTHRQIQDSPFSDYFSDNGRSPEPPDRHGTPSTREKQDLLVRLHRLHSLLADDEEKREVVDIVERKIGEIEGLLSALHSQTRLPADMEDSGLFLDDDEEGEEQGEDGDEGGEEEHGEGEGEGEIDAESEEGEPQSPSAAPHLTQEQKQAEQDFLLLESQRVLQNVTAAQEKLRARCAELKQLNDAHISALAALQSENNILRANVQSNHSDLEFLKQRFVVLENEVRALDAGAQRLETYAPELREEIQAVKRARMSDSMRRWDKEHSVVESRVRTRGGWREEVEGGDGQEDGERRESVVQVELGTGDVEGGMELETVETRGEDGRVKSVLVRRVGGKEEGSSPGLSAVKEKDEGEKDEGLEGVTIVEPVPQTPNPAEADVTEKEAREEEEQADRHSSVTTQPQSIDFETHGLGLTATGSPVSQSLWDRHTDDMDTEDEDEEEEGKGNQLECAITTSSEDNSVPFSSNREKKARQLDAEAAAAASPVKSAWQELWTGLATLAGVREDGW